MRLVQRVEELEGQHAASEGSVHVVYLDGDADREQAIDAYGRDRIGKGKVVLVRFV